MNFLWTVVTCVAGRKWLRADKRHFWNHPICRLHLQKHKAGKCRASGLWHGTLVNLGLLLPLWLQINGKCFNDRWQILAASLIISLQETRHSVPSTTSRLLLLFLLVTVGAGVISLLEFLPYDGMGIVAGHSSCRPLVIVVM